MRACVRNNERANFEPIGTCGEREGAILCAREAGPSEVGNQIIMAKLNTGQKCITMLSTENVEVTTRVGYGRCYIITNLAFVEIR